MSSRYAVIYYALLLCLSLFISACHKDEPENPTVEQNHSKEPSAAIDSTRMVVLDTDSAEWIVYTECTDVLYNDAYSVKSPYHIPTREEAAILKTCTYGDGSQRFVTSDGYTFGMPSVSVTKAGMKTKYSVLGLHIRHNIYDIEF